MTAIEEDIEEKLIRETKEGKIGLLPIIGKKVRFVWHDGHGNGRMIGIVPTKEGMNIFEKLQDELREASSLRKELVK